MSAAVTAFETDQHTEEEPQIQGNISTGAPADGQRRLRLSENMELVSEVQKVILQLLESTKCLQRYIEELYRITEELEEKKADKLMIDSVIKADKCALDSKVSRSKVEFVPVKEQLEGRRKTIQEKLLAQEAPELDDSAALRKQVVDGFHCLSCDRPVSKNISGPERISAISRSCGGRDTIITRHMQFSNLKKMRDKRARDRKNLLQSQQVDIVGHDSHIYKGGLNEPASKNTETKRPTSSTKDREFYYKARCSPSHQPSASVEVAQGTPLHQPHSAKSAQFSRPGHF